MKKGQKIRVIAYIHVGDELVDVDTLDTEQRARLATELKTRYLNAMFAGRAEFTPIAPPSGGD